MNNIITKAEKYLSEIWIEKHISDTINMFNMMAPIIQKLNSGADIKDE